MGIYLRLKKHFKDFSIDVELSADKEFLVLFGPSGAGKSLILKMISGMVRPDEGVVNIGGDVIFDSRNNIDVAMRDRHIGFVFQEYSLFPHMTVLKNISYGIKDPGGADAGLLVRELIGLMRLNGLEQRYPHEISGGQRQRVALARTLAAQPRLILLDEPFSALDNMVREKLRADLMNIHERFPITTMLVTHDLEEAFMMGSRISVVNNGRIEQTGSREDVFYRPITRNVARFLGARNIFTGRIASIEGTEAVIESAGFRALKALVPANAMLRNGQEVSFCIRPEDIQVVRPDKPLTKEKASDNILDAEVSTMVGMGSTHILYLDISSGAALRKDLLGVPALKVEAPNFVVKKLALAQGSALRVLLKKESVWIIP